MCIPTVGICFCDLRCPRVAKLIIWLGAALRLHLLNYCHLLPPGLPRLDETDLGPRVCGTVVSSLWYIKSRQPALHAPIGYKVRPKSSLLHCFLFNS
jgi:hypothetical protein